MSSGKFTTIPLSSITMSCEIDQLFTALSVLQGEMNAIKKENHGHRHKYADINTVLDAILPLLSKNGLAISQHPAMDPHGIQLLMTMLCHKSGQWMSSSSKIVHDTADIQSLGAGITYQRRYALVSILGIEQEDDDGNYSKQKAVTAPKPVDGKIKQDQLNLLTGKIRDNDDQYNTLLKSVLTATRCSSLNDLTEKQYLWLMNKYFNL